MKSPNKKAFRFTFRVNSKKDFGGGPGVLGTQDVVFTDALNQGWKRPSFLLSLEQAKQKALSGFVTVEAVELKRKKA